MAVTALADIDSTAARYNFYAYQSGMHDHLDVDYLGAGGDSSVPILLKLAHGEDEQTAEEAYQMLYWILRQHADIQGNRLQKWENRDIRGVHVAYLNADRLLRQHADEILQRCVNTW